MDQMSMDQPNPAEQSRPDIQKPGFKEPEPPEIDRPKSPTTQSGILDQIRNSIKYDPNYKMSDEEAKQIWADKQASDEFCREYGSEYAWDVLTPDSYKQQAKNMSESIDIIGHLTEDGETV